MRYIKIDEARPDMELGCDLYDSHGRILLGSKTTLNEKTIEKVKKMGIEGIYIEDSLSAGIKIQNVISPKLRANGMQAVKNEDVNGCKNVALEMVKQIQEKKNVSLDLTDLRTFDDYTYSHSVNVAVLSAVIGLGLQLPDKDIQNLALAGLLHDIGKLAIPTAILNKPGRLTPEEYKIMKNHAIYSFEKLKNRMDISAQIKQAVLYHHENMDGSGYPNGVNETSLSLYARVLHVADVYDALVSKRPYKEPYSPYEATEYLMGGCGAMFDQGVVSAFLRYVPIYPKGTEVTLSDGRKAIIYENSGARNMRPIVMILDTQEMVDLWDDDNLNITIVSTAAHGKMVESSEKERNRMIHPERIPKILVVDPDKTNAEMIKLLCNEDFEIKTAASGEGAINYIENFGNPSIVFLEVNLPGMDGVEAAKQIMEKTKNKVPIAFITSARDRDTVIRCRELNPATYILKPYKEMFLKSEVKRIFANGSMWD